MSEDAVLDLRQSRYDRFIAPLLDRFTRPFSLIDVGAGKEGFNSFETARRYPQSIVFMIEKDADYPLPLPPNVWVMKKEFSAGDLERMASCEQFDLVLAMNVLHHFGEWWERAANSILGLGHMIVFQTPYAHDTKACGQPVIPPIHEWLVHNTVSQGESIQWPDHTPRPVYYSRYKPQATLTSTNIESQGNADMEVTSEPDCATFTYREKTRPWIPGMNLWSWRMLGGWSPTLECVIQMLKDFPLPEKNHGDVVPWNFIIHGGGLCLIDGFEGWEFDDKKNLEKTIITMKDGNDNLLKRERKEIPMLRLNIGSGQRKFQPPFVNVDVNPKWEPDVVADGAHMPMFEDGSADVIVLHHVLEHFGCGESKKLLHECHRILEPGGSLIVTVPDLPELAKRWLKMQISTQIYVTNLYGAYLGDEADRHKWGFNSMSLFQTLHDGAEWNHVMNFDWRPIEGADIARDWWILGMEAVK